GHATTRLFFSYISGHLDTSDAPTSCHSIFVREIEALKRTLTLVTLCKKFILDVSIFRCADRWTHCCLSCASTSGHFRRFIDWRRRSVMRRSLLCLLFLWLSIVVSYSGQQPTGVGLRLIVVKTEEEAAGLRNRLQAGEAFEELAKKYSSDASASAGGY